MKETLLKGTGAAAPFIGIAVSLSQIEAWLRILSLAVGLALGVVTLVARIRSRKKK